LGDRCELGKLERRVFLQANGLDGARDRKQDRVSVWLGLRDRTCADSAGAPVLFSTMTGWPTDAESFSATTRDSASMLPPAGSGTTIRINLLGYGALS
jgi:hypothetical protein